MQLLVSAFSVTALAAVLGKICSAQVQTAGRFAGHVSMSSFAKSGQGIIEYTLPYQNNTALRLAAEAEELDYLTAAKHKTIDKHGDDTSIHYNGHIPKAAPFRFGQIIPVHLELHNPEHGEWDETEDIRRWRFKISSPNALSLSIHFSKFKMAPNSELYIVGNDQTFGAFTADVNNMEEGVFSVSPVSGDSLILEYIESIDNAGPESRLEISHIVHGFRETPFSKVETHSASGSCNINVACSEGKGKSDQINAVALLINGLGDSFCSGSMINNQQGRQLFITAEHCINNSSVANFILGFGYQSKNCNDHSNMAPKAITVHGMRLLTKSRDSDYALLEVVEDIPDNYNVFMAGFDASPDVRKVGKFYGIHHPKCDVKKVSLYEGNLDLIRVIDASNKPNFWRINSWAKGTTEPGSSGSPLFDSKHRIIGHLLGGEASCSNLKGSDFYGALSKDWSGPGSIRSFLNPNGESTLKMDGRYLSVIRANRKHEDVAFISGKSPEIDSDDDIEEDILAENVGHAVEGSMEDVLNHVSASSSSSSSSSPHPSSHPSFSFISTQPTRTHVITITATRTQIVINTVTEFVTSVK